jgi:hypothetical protein
MTHRIAMALFVALAGASLAEVPMGGRCISVPPICPPGSNPVCLCESSYSFSCVWICGSVR